MVPGDVVAAAAVMLILTPSGGGRRKKKRGGAATVAEVRIHGVRYADTRHSIPHPHKHTRQSNIHPGTQKRFV